ncbi:MAG TPA: YihY/virulence factor BrkB family protein [Streptosporangiaceae bacterium]
MNPAEWVVRRLDGAQQRFTPAAFIFAVQKKFGDDNGGVLVTNLAFTAFLSLFPLLLVLMTILGLVSSVEPSFRTDVVDAVSQQIPLIGRTLTENVDQLRRSSVIGLIVGLVALLWGSTGLAQAGIFTMEQVWNLPGPDRPGFVQRLGRSGIFLGLLAFGVIVTTLLTGLSTYGHNTAWLVIPAQIAAALANVGMFVAAFRILTPKAVVVRRLLPGAIVAGVCWTLLQVLGTYLVHHFLRTDSVYGVFATVLGLIAWIYVAVRVIVYSAEVNVVLARRLWPRSIVQPPLLKADRESLTLQALQNQRRKEQHVEVTFDETA